MTFARTFCVLWLILATVSMFAAKPEDVVPAVFGCLIMAELLYLRSKLEDIEQKL